MADGRGQVGGMREDPAATTLTIQRAEIPKVGLGTWQITGGAATEAVADALALGYRHIDTARAYGNEAEVGRGLREGGVRREEVWLTTKVWIEDYRRDDLHRSAEASLRDLQTDYLDLLLLHWPQPEVPLAESLNALEELREDGRIRHLGVSNFPPGLLREALELAPVLTNQVEYHPYLGQPALLEICRERDVMLTAYSPFAHGELLREPVLQEIGEAHGKTAGQVALRWLLDQPNVSAVPKAGSTENRRANLDVFDFALTDEERGRIAGLERGHRVIDPSFAPDWDEVSRA